MMRKVHLVALMLFATTVVSAFAAMPAFAEEVTLPAEYLWNATPIAEGAKLPTDSTNVGVGLVLLADMEVAGAEVDILCSWLLAGEIVGTKDLKYTEVLNLANNSKVLSCLVDSRGPCEGELAKVEAINLPWLLEPLLVGAKFQLMLMKGTGVIGNPGYRVECETILGKETDECTGETDESASNVSEGIESEFSESEEVTPDEECTLSKARSGLMVGLGITTDNEGGTLTLSSEA